MTRDALRIAVIGAGIGGLTAAIALRRAGFGVQVYERAERLHELGAGLTLQPNAILALRQLGLGERVERAGVALRAGALMRADGSPLSRMPRDLPGALLKELGAGIVGVHRGTLQALLLDALGPDAVQLGRVCTGYVAAGEARGAARARNGEAPGSARERNGETRGAAREQNQDGVRACFADGSELECDALIGADGLRSAVRAQWAGDGEPIYAGYTSWRGVTRERCGVPADFGGELWGRGQRFGGCCIDGERFYWFAVANAPAGAHDASASDTKAGLLARFEGWWGGRVSELVRSTPEHAILRTDISDRLPLARWGEGAITLLGDAAHPMTPNLGQGACQAIEDALVLGLELGRAASIQAGLRAYEAARRERANAVVTTARRLGAVGQWKSPLACAVRDRLFGLLPAAVVKKQLLEAWRLPYGAPSGQ